MTGRATPWGIRARGQRRIRHARAPLSRPSSRSAPSPDHRHHRTDGSYLAEFLPEKGYDVVGMVRRASTESFERIEGDLLDQLSLDGRYELNRRKPSLVARRAPRREEANDVSLGAGGLWRRRNDQLPLEPMTFPWERRVLPSPLGTAGTPGGGGGSGGAATNQNDGAGAAGIKGRLSLSTCSEGRRRWFAKHHEVGLDQQIIEADPMTAGKHMRSLRPPTAEGDGQAGDFKYQIHEFKSRPGERGEVLCCRQAAEQAELDITSAALRVGADVGVGFNVGAIRVVILREMEVATLQVWAITAREVIATKAVPEWPVGRIDGAARAQHAPRLAKNGIQIATVLEHRITGGHINRPIPQGQGGEITSHEAWSNRRDTVPRGLKCIGIDPDDNLRREGEPAQRVPPSTRALHEERPTGDRRVTVQPRPARLKREASLRQHTGQAWQPSSGDAQVRACLPVEQRSQEPVGQALVARAAMRAVTLEWVGGLRGQVQHAADSTT